MVSEVIMMEGLRRISNIIEELDQKVSEAIRASQEVGLTQVARVLETVKSYVELLKRELEVEF
ncbi:hypothetical protein DSO06_05035 [Candidatus Nezhaarchaeota archaeon WYZ-LMO8]|nr:MAG: hypothetical protein DSO06_05035 [Candidatus Nezhaarchaeota archaeon WYZ-LMO8]TDA35909.1 MAG: hypothetical protein DSO05_04560 [Candidatus Nezhaarchaeota archaeon WYZ-LMO7]